MAGHTKADLARFDRLNQMGCIACRINNGSWVQSEVAHVTDSGRRVGHQATIPLCPWHHRAVVPSGLDEKEMTRIYGPSFAKGKATFYAAFGSEHFLLDKTDIYLGKKKRD